MALPQFRDCYDFEFFPVNGSTGGDVFKAPVTVAMCVELDGLTPAQLAKRSLFQIFFYHPQTNRLDVLDNASATFLPCETGRLAGDASRTRPRSFAGVLQLGWYAAVSGLRALVGPRPLFASSAMVHLGLGGKLCTPGTTCKLSTGTWGLPAELRIYGGDGQSAAVNTAVATPPSVIVTDTSGTPLEGAVVTFSVLSGGGSITAAVDTTGPDGIAQVGSWTLGVTPGINTLMASVAGATPASVTFTATGSEVVSLIDCGGDPSGDLIDRGFYVPAFPGTSLSRATLHFSARSAGTYTFSLTARHLTYDGPVLGTASASVELTDNDTINVATTFTFAAVAVEPASTVTFSIAQIAGPTTASVFYSVPRVDDAACPVIQTEGTTPPLDRQRRRGVHVKLEGAAQAPIQ